MPLVVALNSSLASSKAMRKSTKKFKVMREVLMRQSSEED